MESLASSYRARLQAESFLDEQQAITIAPAARVGFSLRTASASYGLRMALPPSVTRVAYGEVDISRFPANQPQR
jgi:hypothetical protein